MDKTLSDTFLRSEFDFTILERLNFISRCKDIVPSNIHHSAVSGCNTPSFVKNVYLQCLMWVKCKPQLLNLIFLALTLIFFWKCQDWLAPEPSTFSEGWISETGVDTELFSHFLAQTFHWDTFQTESDRQGGDKGLLIRATCLIRQHPRIACDCAESV